MTPLAQLIDQRRELVAQVAGLDVEICMALGDRSGADSARREMEAHTAARWAAREAGCYFDAMGEQDAAAMKGARSHA